MHNFEKCIDKRVWGNHGHWGCANAYNETLWEVFMEFNVSVLTGVIDVFIALKTMLCSPRLEFVHRVWVVH